MTGGQDVTDTYELAVVPEAALVIEPGPSNIERCRLLHHARKLVDLEFALRVKAELDGPGSKTQQMVADEIGCSQMTISRALELLGLQRDRAKIANKTESFNGDLENEPAGVAHPCEVCGNENPDSFEYDICPACDPERIVQAELVYEDEDDELSPQMADAIARHERLMAAARDEERRHPEEPVAELLELQRALRAATAKLRTLKDAGRQLNAAPLAQRIAELCHELEELLCL